MPAICISLLMTMSAPALLPGSGQGSALPDFELRDAHGTVHRLSDGRKSKLVVVAFVGVECPLARLYAPRLAAMAREYENRGVAFIGIDANRHDAPGAILDYGRQHELPFPILRDTHGQVANLLGARRTPEVFVLDERRTVRYRGRIDDQYGVGGLRRPAAAHRDLATALETLLSGGAVAEPVTEAVGCVIDRELPARPGTKATYCKEIAPILQAHCLSCHRPGQIAPFPLTCYEEAAGWAETIAEVVAQGRMPPWGADPAHGKFANDPSLSDAEKARIEAWVAGGAPEGDPADLPRQAAFSETWNIPGPDQVVAMSDPFTVPPQGVIEYQSFVVDPGFREDRWIRAAEILPGNRRVVHHCSVFLQPPGSDQAVTQGALGSFCLATAGPGTPPLLLPEDMAKLVPAGWRLVFVMHYTPVGTVQQDQTRLGLSFADPAKVRKEVATKLLYDEHLIIPPRTPDHVVEQTWRTTEDVLLLALFPHMHLRGKSFRYEADYPGGRQEILLDVPRFDFNWQNRYVFSRPMRVPAGTVLRCVAHYDNSAANPANPDPDAVVHAGPQSWDEMFNGYFEWALADQDLTVPPTLGVRVRRTAQAVLTPGIVGVLVPAAGAFLVLSRVRRARANKGL
jgi:peroxiredoxin